MRRFELSEGSSNKFWEIDLAGESFTVCWGRIGTNGQTQTKTFASAEKAEAERDKLVAEKVKKGYLEVGGGPGQVPTTSAPKASATKAPAGKPSVAKAPAAKTPAAKPSAAKAPATKAAATAGNGPKAPPSTNGGEAPPVATAASADRTVAQAPVTAIDGITWPPTVLREVAPRRGSDLVRPKKGDAKTAFAKIKSAFGAASQLLEKGLGVRGARADLQRAAIAAFAGGPEESLDVDVQAAAYALVGPPFAWREPPRRAAFIEYWTSVEGPHFAFEAVVSAGGLGVSAVSRSDGSPSHRALVAGTRKEGERRPWWDDAEGAWRSLRHAALLGEADRARIEAIVGDARHALDPETRVLVVAGLDHADWAREALEDEIRAATSHHGVALRAWPLLLSLPLEEVKDLVPRLAPSGWALIRGVQAIRFDLLATFGGAAARFYLSALTEGESAGADVVRSVAEALAICERPEVTTFFLGQLGSKDLRAIASGYLEAHATSTTRAVAKAALAKGPHGDAARAVLRAIVARQKDAVTAAEAGLDGPARALIASFRDAAEVSEEASPDEVPRVLRDPPWRSKVKAPPPKSITPPALLSHPETLAWGPGEREQLLELEGWKAPKPEERATTLMAIQKANEGRAAVTGYNEPRGSLFAQLPQADAPKAFNEAKLSAFSWSYYRVVPTLVARHGLDVLPGAIRFAEVDLVEAVESLVRVDSPRVAPVMAEAYARSKKARDVAASWLSAFPETAAVGLVPGAVGPDGPARRHAEAGLRLLVLRKHRDLVESVAERYGAEAKEIVLATLDADPLLAFPKKLPALPAFFVATGLTRPLLRGTRKALPLAAVEHLGTMLAFAAAEPYPGIEQVKEACDPRSLADFAWDLFQAWLVAGAPSKEAWAFLTLGPLGDDESARRLTPLVRAWPGEAAHARAVLGLEVLARIGTDVALMHLHGIAQKVKFKGLQEKAREKIDQIAEARGLSAEELADRLVPDLGLDDDGTLRLDFGARSFSVVFDESLRPAVQNEAGKRLPDLPKPNQSDDAEKAGAAVETWRALKKDAKTIAQGQLVRLELAMCGERRWTTDVFRNFLLGHPLLVHLVRRLVWGVFDEEGALTDSFRVAEDGTLASREDDTFVLPEDARLGIVHRLHLDDRAASAWGQVFADYEILQPFEQLSRATTAMRDDERTATQTDRVRGRKVPTGKVLGLDARGWRRGPPQDAGVVCWYEKRLAGEMTVCLDLDPGIFTGYVGESPEQTLGAVAVHEGTSLFWFRSEDRLPLGRLSPIAYSELVRDLDALQT